MSLGMFFSVNYLQALPLPATTQNVQQIFQQLAEMPLLPASEVPAVAQKRQMLPFFTPQVLNSLFEQDTTPAVLKTFQDAKPNKRKEAIAKNPKILVIVDGKKLGTLENGGEAALDKIDVATIATVNILKDESAVAIYGEEGKDGVIIINTKKGESSDAAVVVNTVIDQPASDVKPAIAAGADARNDHEPMPAQSFDDSKLLIIVDGKNWGHISSDSKNSPLNAINPEDIATMDVLKGKTAIEKYGKEGENGVIEIRTKTKMKVKTKN
jgi:TonB-dependent SusC/RagA subfamily outer membrane receptor